VKATARGTVGWRHAFGDATPLSTFAFAGGDAFPIAGVPIAEDAVLIEGGIDIDLAAARGSACLIPARSAARTIMG